jgi:hypothetical protein
MLAVSLAGSKLISMDRLYGNAAQMSRWDPQSSSQQGRAPVSFFLPRFRPARSRFSKGSSWAGDGGVAGGLPTEAVVRPLATCPRLSRQAVLEACERLRLNKSQVYELLRRYRVDPRTTSLVPAFCPEILKGSPRRNPGTRIVAAHVAHRCGGDRPLAAGRGGASAASKAVQRHFSGSKATNFPEQRGPFSGAVATDSARADHIAPEFPVEQDTRQAFPRRSGQDRGFQRFRPS